ncbi:hypothetical protein [Virgibacillus necropolis]|uniref:DUF1819 domain-containing protein n=1 Tax=Virgibacillus necropolis TaxID=163877 RepID=A0A221M894_9BACI|nr:hypothetical protein [Virgibacillus necropolis]ASN03851.1 hypothetical protein CFK40_01955 [Virgibacillus necropolis]
MTKPVGFDQKVLLHYLDYTAKQSRKLSKKDMYAVLDGYLREDITGAKSRKNVITMLMKIWYNVPHRITNIRDEVLIDINDFSKEERLFAHWCMMIIAYPFFKEVVNEFGRLFQLQDTVSSMSIGKRMKDSYGDRRRVEVATSAVISSLKAWEIILPSENRSYIQNDKVSISTPLLQVLLFGTVLSVLDSESLYVNTITSHALFFPFQFDLNLHELRERKDYFIFHYQGVENLVVERV